MYIKGHGYHLSGEFLFFYLFTFLTELDKRKTTCIWQDFITQSTLENTPYTYGKLHNMLAAYFLYLGSNTATSAGILPEKQVSNC